jgi:hypothetical protein
MPGSFPAEMRRGRATRGAFLATGDPSGTLTWPGPRAGKLDPPPSRPPRQPHRSVQQSREAGIDGDNRVGRQHAPGKATKREQEEDGGRIEEGQRQPGECPPFEAAARRAAAALRSARGTAMARASGTRQGQVSRGTTTGLLPGGDQCEFSTTSVQPPHAILKRVASGDEQVACGSSAHLAQDCHAVGVRRVDIQEQPIVSHAG